MSIGSFSRRAFLRQGAALAAAGVSAPLWLPRSLQGEAWARTRGAVAFPGGTTYERTIVPVTPEPYSLLREAEGWPLVVRDDLGTRGRPNRELRRVALASILHLTDVQVPDAQSPARVEWLSRFGEIFRAAWRPHETVVNHISAAAVARSRTVGRGPVTGRRYDFAVSTGDNIDNMQENELRWFLTLLNGGDLNPGSGAAPYEGVQAYWRNTDLPADVAPEGYDDFYWRPDEPPAGFWPDRWKAEHGYPTLHGFLDAATAPFHTAGLGAPWYSMYGNHDGLVQGNAPANPFFQAIATGDVVPGPIALKLVGFPPGYGWSELEALRFFDDLLRQAVPPEVLLQAPAEIVAADPTRRLVGPHEYVRAHWEWTDGAPRGHGFSEDNLGDGATQEERDRNTTLYYTFRPVEGVPLLGIALDTTNRLGGAAGSIGRRQYEWLEARLREVHTRWYDADGRPQRRRGRGEDALVVMFAHHNLETMDNLLPSPDDPDRVSGDEVRALLHRYPNVIAFVNGHSHINRVWARSDERTGGFWEISTSAQLDYPMQVRVLELADNRDGTLSLFCTLVDQGGPADAREVFGAPGDGYELLELAAYGRELAYNDYRDHANHGDPFAHRVGTPGDRNVELVVAAPFPLGTTGPPERVREAVPAGRP